MIDRHTAQKLLACIPEDKKPSLEPCYDVNHRLWYVWCEATGRPNWRSDVWSEYDVSENAALIIKAHLSETIQS